MSDSIDLIKELASYPMTPLIVPVEKVVEILIRAKTIAKGDPMTGASIIVMDGTNGVFHAAKVRHTGNDFADFLEAHPEAKSIPSQLVRAYFVWRRKNRAIASLAGEIRETPEERDHVIFTRTLEDLPLLSKKTFKTIFDVLIREAENHGLCKCSYLDCQWLIINGEAHGPNLEVEEVESKETASMKIIKDLAAKDITMDTVLEAIKKAKQIFKD